MHAKLIIQIFKSILKLECKNQAYVIIVMRTQLKKKQAYVIIVMRTQWKK